jgi:hypothetical protein
MRRKSVAHNIARRERAEEAANPIRGKSNGKSATGPSSEAQHEPAYELQHQNHDKDEHATGIAPEVESEGVTDIEAEMQEDDVEDEVEDVTPPPPQPRRRNPNTTRGRNPPLAPPAFLEFGGGPYDLSMLSAFGKHVADW